MDGNLLPSGFFYYRTTLLLLFLLCSCGHRNVDLARGIHPDQIDSFSGEKTDRRAKARAAARSGVLQCTIEGECEPSIALVSVVTDQGLERCSGVLISEDRVLTNDHCVDKSLSLIGWSTRHKGLPCKGSVYVHFSGDGERSARHAGCLEIEFRSGESGINSQDYAVIRLDQPITDRKPMKIAKRGFRDQESARILRVQMDQGGGAFLVEFRVFFSVRPVMQPFFIRC
ncbi:MAG: trypsin-like peptidase domain-containing protein [Bdellovibrionales bacterium]|nr:trypsin-like peptidase domain-containing protein [Bdellovibrionales bacterium]